MRHTAGEKYAIIRLVEGSDLPLRHTLRELQVHRSTFYAWYRRYAAHGQIGLAPKAAAARRYWNRMPPRVRQRVVEAVLAAPDQSPWELAWQLTDQEVHFLSESSVYRILKAVDLIPSPAYSVVVRRPGIFQFQKLSRDLPHIDPERVRQPGPYRWPRRRRDDLVARLRRTRPCALPGPAAQTLQLRGSEAD